MVIDLKRCVGCNSCAVACKQENATPPGVLRTKVEIGERGEYPNTRLTLTSLICMHCEDPECVKVCPTGATQKLDNGIVIIQKDRCLGCQFCIMACPYNARTFVGKINPQFPEKEFVPYEVANSYKHQAGVVDKCDFCLERLNNNLQPACVAACPAKARIFGDLDDPLSEVNLVIAERAGFRLLEDKGFRPSVYYVK